MSVERNDLGALNVAEQIEVPQQESIYGKKTEGSVLRKTRAEIVSPSSGDWSKAFKGAVCWRRPQNCRPVNALGRS